MQGYIVRINPCKEEDLIVSILTKDAIVTAYRFYGARHSVCNLGYKIDAELIYSAKSQMPQLRNVLHLSNKWLYDNAKMLLWQNFISLFYNHLKGVEELDEFYFCLLRECEEKMSMQDPKRVQVEAYLKLLEFEGRLHDKKRCFFCEKQITQTISFIRAFLPICAECATYGKMDLEKINELFSSKSTMFLDDDEVDFFWHIMHEGF